MRQVFLFVSLAVVGFGAYLKFLYDVPDSQEAINSFVSGFLIIIGIASLLVNLFWKSPSSPKGPRE